MFCPECGVLMRAVEHAGVGAQVCPRCAGMWLRRDDLTSLVEHEAGELALAFGEGDRERERDDYFREIGVGVGASHGAPHPYGYPGEPPHHAAHHAHGVLDALRRLALAAAAAPAPEGAAGTDPTAGTRA